MNTFDENETEVQQVIGLAAVAAHFEVENSDILGMADRGEFPAPMRLGRRALRWKVKELNAWIESGGTHK